jgi:hypothetical protein
VNTLSSHQRCRPLRLFAAALAVLCIQTSVLTAGDESSALEFREIRSGDPTEITFSIPRDAVQVFVYEGEAESVEVDQDHVVVDYGLSCCRFDRKTGKLARRSTVADGWTEKPLDDGPLWPKEEPPTGLVGPGVVPPGGTKKDEAAGEVVAASITFRGETWKAMQPRWDFSADGDRSQRFKTWTEILRSLNRRGYLKVGESTNPPARRYTIADGLASNIVSKFAVADGILWAVCVDMFDEEKGEWGPGGLCQYSPGRDRWTRVESIAGHPVRWVTLLETIGDELWVAFREGHGIDGEKIFYGMGIHLKEYRPNITAITLARLKHDRWYVYSRPPVAEKDRSPTERPVSVVRFGDNRFLYSHVNLWDVIGWQDYHEGFVSAVDLESGEWTTWDAGQNFRTRELTGLVSKNGEILVTSNRGVHQYVGSAGTWRFLDPAPALENPAFAAVQPVGNELWLAYGKRAWGRHGEQGIARFHEKTGRWTRMSQKELGTVCPVREMVLMPNEDLYVLFHPYFPDALSICIYPYGGSECDPPRVGALGRYSDGNWEYPLPLEGVPATTETIDREGDSGREFRRSERLPIKGLVRVGENLFLSTGMGVYMGPSPWREVFTIPDSWNVRVWPSPPLDIAPSDDGEAVIITFRNAETYHKNRTIKRARYVPGESEVHFENIVEQPVRGKEEPPDDVTRKLEEFRKRWTRVPVKKDSEWVVGPFAVARRVVETPPAVWLICRGELIRLDRMALAEWLGLPEDAD